MERDELDRMAWRGEEIPRELSCTDTLYYLIMRNLYDFSRSGRLDADTGKREKQKIEDSVRQFRAAQDCAVRYGDVMRDTGAARAEYRKARNDMGRETALYLPPAAVKAIAAADRLAEILDNLKIEV